MNTQGKTILLHCCCAVCACGCIDRLLEEGYRITLFFSNSNLAPAKEWERRLAAMRTLAELRDLPLIVDEPDHGAWLRHIAGLEEEPERGARCERCFAFSLNRTAEKCRALGLDVFATTLTVSPHKNSKLIFSVGSRWENFECWDFKKKNGFQKAMQLSAEYGLYRQNYCGCEFSRRDAGLTEGKEK